MSLFQRFAVELTGAVTSLLTAIIIVFVQRVVGISIFTWFVWLVVPAGALLCGAVAASGYYLGSLYYERRPNWTLAVTMAIVGLATYFLIYFIDYMTAITDDGRSVRAFVSFTDFMLLSLTTARYAVQHIDPDGTEVGGFGILLGGLQAIGFMIGAVAVYMKLRDLPACGTCNRLFVRLFRIKKKFGDDGTFALWHARMDRADPRSPEFASLLSQPVRRVKTEHGCVDVDCTLLGCSGCDAQIVIHKSRFLDGRQWKDLPTYERELQIPPGASLRQVFHATARAERS